MKSEKDLIPLHHNELDKYLQSLGLKRNAVHAFTKLSGYWHYLTRRNRNDLSNGFSGDFDTLLLEDPRIDVGMVSDVNAIHEEKPLKALNFTMKSFEGALIDLGNGSWVVSGTAYGTKQYGSDPPFANISSSYLIQYTAATDTLDWALGGCTWSASGVSAPNSPVTIFSDISVPKVSIVVRTRLQFSCLNFSQGNYFTLQP